VRGESSPPAHAPDHPDRKTAPSDFRIQRRPLPNLRRFTRPERGQGPEANGRGPEPHAHLDPVFDVALEGARPPTFLARIDCLYTSNILFLRVGIEAA